jgi:hypothetical protein
MNASTIEELLDFLEQRGLRPITFREGDLVVLARVGWLDRWILREWFDCRFRAYAPEAITQPELVAFEGFWQDKELVDAVRLRRRERSADEQPATAE